MADLKRRMRMAAESILENEALRGGLGDEQASRSLLDWGVACAESLTLETAQIEDDEEADEAIYARMKGLRKMLVAAQEVVTQAQSLAGLQESVGNLFRYAALVYGPNWQAARPLDEQFWLRFSQLKASERLSLLRDVIENRSTPGAEQAVSFEMESFLVEPPSEANVPSQLQSKEENIKEEHNNKGEANVTFGKKTPI